MFNLKDPKNNILFKKVLKGEVTPDHLIRMSPEELASKELAAWRRRENRHVRTPNFVFRLPVSTECKEKRPSLPSLPSLCSTPSLLSSPPPPLPLTPPDLAGPGDSLSSIF